MKILMVLTSHDKLGDTGRKTGFWLEELAAPYYVFRDPEPRSRSRPPKAAGLRSTPRATNRNSGPTLPAGSRRTPLPKLSSTRPFVSTA